MGDVPAELAGRVPGYWSPQRVKRLRYELDLIRMPEDGAA